MSASTAGKRNWSVGGWLALALLIHALLLLLPLGLKNSAARKSTVVSVTLSPLPITGVAPEPETAMSPHQPPVQPSAKKPDDPDPPDSGVSSPAEVRPDTPPTPTMQAVTLARLVDSIQQGKLDTSPTVNTRTLGLASSGEKPPHWRHNAAASRPEENLFGGMFAPASTEIVDRWLAADGSQNVVINLPNGETLCGRAEAWNPMQPLVEHVMMFRSCGGGGKRTFTMAPRLQRELPVATDG